MLSICIPAHATAFPLLHRTLLSFAAQTCLAFEVVVAIDGPGQFTVTETPYPLLFVRTPRTDSPLPHRNHARNAAAKAASGDLLWFVDCDFLWDEHTVEHLLEANHTPISPILVTIRDTPDRWLTQKGWDQNHDNDIRQFLLRGLAVQANEWSGYARHYRPNGGVLVKSFPEPMPEGFPMVRAADFQGFDERFLGHGGNKESFVAGLEDYRLLASARGYHQPHHSDAQDEALTDHNRRMFEDV